MTSGAVKRPDEGSFSGYEGVADLAAARMKREPRLKDGEPPPPPGPPPIDAKALRKHRAKRFNEQLKAVYGFLNTLAAAVIVTGYISPAIKSEPLPYGLDTPGLVLIGLGLHLSGLAALRFLTRREE